MPPKPPGRCTMSAAAAAREPEPGDRLSPSQAKTFLHCSAKWAFKHILRLPDWKTGALLQGAAVHAAIAENFRQKLETHQDLPFAGVVAVYRDAWRTLREETEFRDDEIPSELEREGEALIRAIEPDATSVAVAWAP